MAGSNNTASIEATVLHSGRRFLVGAALTVGFGLTAIAAAALSIDLAAPQPLDSANLATLRGLADLAAGLGTLGIAGLVVLRALVTTGAPGRVHEDGVYVGERCIVRFGTQEDAFYERQGTAGRYVTFVGAGGRVLCKVAVKSDAEATLVLSMAGTPTRPRWWLPSRTRIPPALAVAIFYPLFNAVSNMFSSSHPLAWLFVALAVPIGLMAVRRRRVEITRDDVELGGLVRTKTIALQAIRRIRPVELEFVRLEHDGGTTDVRAGSDLGLEGGALASRRDLLLQQLHDALARDHTRDQLRRVAEQLTRGARTVDSWLADLASMRSREAYRSSAFRDEDLWAILEEPGVSDDARAAAALLLRRADDAQVGERIRVAIAEAESPRLRVAVERILETTDDEAALSELESPAKRAILR